MMKFNTFKNTISVQLSRFKKIIAEKVDLKTMKERLHDAEINMKSKNQELDYFKEKAKRIKINTSFAKDALITKKEMDIRK